MLFHQDETVQGHAVGTHRLDQQVRQQREFVVVGREPTSCDTAQDDMLRMTVRVEARKTGQFVRVSEESNLVRRVTDGFIDKPGCR